MKYLGAITDNNDLVTKGYVDEQAVDYAQIYDSLSPDLQQKLEDDYGFDRDMFISEAGTSIALMARCRYLHRRRPGSFAGFRVMPETFGGNCVRRPGRL